MINICAYKLSKNACHFVQFWLLGEKNERLNLNQYSLTNSGEALMLVAAK